MLNLYGASQPKQDLADQLDYSQNDDRIIGHLARFREDNPSADARLLTRDSGPVLTVGTLDIPCEIIPDDWLLAPEPDDRDREIQDLTRQLGELRAQEPAFHFSCDQQSDARPGHVEIAYKAFRPLEETERVQLLERLQNLYPPTVVTGGRISDKAISEYEERDYPAWISQCQKFLDRVNLVVQLEHWPELTVSIQNNGSRPATNALVEVRASGNFGLTTVIGLVAIVLITLILFRGVVGLMRGDYTQQFLIAGDSVSLFIPGGVKIILGKWPVLRRLLCKIPSIEFALARASVSEPKSASYSMKQPGAPPWRVWEAFCRAWAENLIAPHELA